MWLRAKDNCALCKLNSSSELADTDCFFRLMQRKWGHAEAEFRNSDCYAPAKHNTANATRIPDYNEEVIKYGLQISTIWSRGSDANALC